ncbi:hypothetical protein BH20GEM2_BH20GEM2_12160 [soil metagenome]
MTNIFFTDGSDSLRTAAKLGDGWTAVEFAEVVAAEGLLPVYAARYKIVDSEEEWHYVVDTLGTLDFVRSPTLTFRQEGPVRVADFSLDVRSTFGAHQRLPYQIITAEAEGYTYARIAEYLTGQVQFGGREYMLKVRARSRNDPFYTLGPGTEFLADLDGDGQIAEGPAALIEGMPAAAEQVPTGAPFRLGEDAYQFYAIDSAGTRLVVGPSRTLAAAVEGFETPSLTGDLLSGGRYELSPRAGGVTLIEFWATDCPFTEQVRPAANMLAGSLKGKPFTWVAVVNGQDRAAVEQHLTEHPMDAIVVLPDSTTWEAYNPETITPLFVVGDDHGIVRYRAKGASAMEPVAAKVRSLLGGGSS